MNFAPFSFHVYLACPSCFDEDCLDASIMFIVEKNVNLGTWFTTREQLIFIPKQLLGTLIMFRSTFQWMNRYSMAFIINSYLKMQILFLAIKSLINTGLVKWLTFTNQWLEIPSFVCASDLFLSLKLISVMTEMHQDAFPRFTTVHKVPIIHFTWETTLAIYTTLKCQNMVKLILSFLPSMHYGVELYSIPPWLLKNIISVNFPLKGSFHLQKQTKHNFFSLN